MVTIPELWLPILLSAVAVFVASSVIHMFLGYHFNDYGKLPDENAFADAIRKLNIPAGSYMFPKPSSAADMKTAEYQEKAKKGPGVILTTWPGANPNMASNLAMWFVFCLVVGVFAAYVAGRALPAGADYLAVFRFAGVTAFVAHTLGGWGESIWYKRPWSVTAKNTFDGLVYALLTAGVFGWLWPR